MVSNSLVRYNSILNLNMTGVISMGLLRMIVLVMVVLWLLGFALNIGGGLIHALIVIAVILFIFDLIGGRGRGRGGI